MELSKWFDFPRRLYLWYIKREDLQERFISSDLFFVVPFIMVWETFTKSPNFICFEILDLVFLLLKAK